MRKYLDALTRKPIYRSKHVREKLSVTLYDTATGNWYLGNIQRFEVSYSTDILIVCLFRRKIHNFVSNIRAKNADDVNPESLICMLLHLIKDLGEVSQEAYYEEWSNIVRSRKDKHCILSRVINGAQSLANIRQHRSYAGALHRECTVKCSAQACLKCIWIDNSTPTLQYARDKFGDRWSIIRREFDKVARHSTMAINFAKIYPHLNNSLFNFSTNDFCRALKILTNMRHETEHK